MVTQRQGIHAVLGRAQEGALLCSEEAMLLATDVPLESLCRVAGLRRDASWGHTLTYSPKVFIPLTNLCRNRCDYCSFRRSPGMAGAWTMSPSEVVEWLDRGRDAGCIEALFCLGDTPETGFSAYRRELAGWGFDSTVSYLVEAGAWALERGLLPHTNAGILSVEDMTRLRAVNASLGLMLESVSDRLCEAGGPHRRAPDKRPARRLQMHRDAGELAIPFTSGLLLGIGETLMERVETLLALRDLQAAHGHLQEVIVQNFRSREGIPMAGAPEPSAAEVVQAVALARLILPDEVSVQAPPNLNPASIALLIDAGINDFGGISPVSPDYINPGHAWPHIERLAQRCHARGYELRPRLPIYERFMRQPAFVDAALRPAVAHAHAGLARQSAAQSVLSVVRAGVA